jgi:hypothetical protein
MFYEPHLQSDQVPVPNLHLCWCGMLFPEHTNDAYELNSPTACERPGFDRTAVASLSCGVVQASRVKEIAYCSSAPELLVGKRSG